MQERQWQWLPADEQRRRLLSEQLGVSPLTAQVLINRGYREPEEARRFLQPELRQLHNPWGLPDMVPAVARLRQAVERQERVTVYGDFDVDGISGTAILVQALRRLRLDAAFYIPHRLKEGFGLHPQAVDGIARDGCQLLVTVDCGTVDLEAVEAARARGMEVVVTDHHQPGTRLPPALAVVNPSRPDQSYSNPALSGAGVALKLLQSLAQELHLEEAWWTSFLDLAALGTLADVVELRGENRVLAHLGLEQIRRQPRPGIRALLEVAGLEASQVQEGQVTFGLAPRLNAGGRLGAADRGVELLLSRDEDETGELAQELDAENRRRQQIESRVLEEAREYLEQHPREAEAPVLVLGSPDWHQGVVGIVASRLAEVYERPVFLVSWGPEGVGRGSARGRPGFHVQQALEACRELLLAGGGHEQAGGFSLRKEDFPAVRQRLWELARPLRGEDPPPPQVAVEARVSLGELTPELARELRQLAPFGPGNPEPLFSSAGVQMLERRQVGQNGKHLKLSAWQGERCLDAIGFGLGSDLDQLPETEGVELLFALGLDYWQGQERLQLFLKDWRPGSPETSKNREYRVLDRRGAGIGEALGEVLEHPAVLYVSSAREAWKWTQSLRCHLRGGAVEAYHGGLSPREQTRVLRRFITGQVQVLVATSALDLGQFPPRVRRLGWIHPTPHPGEFLRLGRMLCPDEVTGEIALLFNEDTEQRVRRLVERLVPTVELVEAVWQLLARDSAPEAGWTSEEVADRLSRGASEPPALPAVRSALEILREQGAAHGQDRQGGEVFRAPGNGRWPGNPEKTAVYQECVEQRKYFLEFLEFLSRAPACQVEEFVRDGSIFPQGREASTWT